ncbi:uncharacterized protein TNCT_443221 [Trichonephila clavata]|uniref:Uncharacterized protein n=1 Tax=Trichonephila clavata TaxID=2740835 RepID=A0A8X6HZM6_TRICU|nr:uncharacterized protein TNCT_443221 [Trichonephila clavata]
MPKYETNDTTHDEVYVIHMDRSINWGVDKEGNQRYAKKENGDEYYPANGEFACNPSGSPQYARTRDEKVIIPLDAERNDSYLKDEGESHVIYMDLQEAKYPLDEYGNEYTLEIPIQIAGKEKGYFPRGYPITNDNWVIVPEVDGKEFISDQLLPKVQATNIIGKLYREGKNYRDCVTNVKSTRLSRAARQKYNIFPYVLGASNPPPLNNRVNPPPIPPNKPLPKFSQPLKWSLMGIFLMGFIYFLYQFFFKATQ